jgi:hypothetical protein
MLHTFILPPSPPRIHAALARRTARQAAAGPLVMGAALAAGTILSLTAYLAVDLLGEIRGDIKDLGGKMDAMQASVGADIKDLGGKIDATQASVGADIKDLGGKIDAL